MRGNLVAILGSFAASLTIVLVIALLAGACDNLSDPLPDGSEDTSVACLRAPVAPTGSASIGGRAELCIGDGSIRTVVQLEQLADDTAYAAWLAYFDQPTLCAASPCSEGDLP
jgi:hypothetical protein